MNLFLRVCGWNRSFWQRKLSLETGFYGNEWISLCSLPMNFPSHSILIPLNNYPSASWIKWKRSASFPFPNFHIQFNFYHFYCSPGCQYARKKLNFVFCNRVGHVLFWAQTKISKHKGSVYSKYDILRETIVYVWFDMVRLRLRLIRNIFAQYLQSNRYASEFIEWFIIIKCDINSLDASYVMAMAFNCMPFESKQTILQKVRKAM